MKKVFNIFRIVLGVLIGLYIMALIGLNLDVCQRWLGRKASAELSEYVNAPVEIERVSIGLFNRVTLYNVSCVDPEGHRVMQSQYVEGKIELWPLITEKKIKLNTIALLDADLDISRNKDGKFNIQYLIDAFSSKDSQKESKINLTADVVIVRRSKLKFTDELHSELTASISDLDLNMSLYQLSNNSLSVRLRRCGFEMDNGERLHNLKMQLEVDRDCLSLQHLDMRTNNMHLSIPSLNATYCFPENASLPEVIKSLNVEPFVMDAGVQDLAIHCKAAFADCKADIKMLQIHERNNLVDLELDGEMTLAEKNDSAGAMKLSVESATLNLRKVHAEAGSLSQTYGHLQEASPLLQKFVHLPQLPERVVEIAKNVGSMDATGSLTLIGMNQGNANLILQSGAGNIEVNASLQNNIIKANAMAENLQPSVIFANGELPSLASFTIEGDASLKGESFNAKMDMPQLNWRESEYSNISMQASLQSGTFDLQLNLNDEAVQAALAAKADRDLAHLTLEAELNNWRQFLPQQIHSVSGKLEADLHNLKTSTPEGYVKVDDLELAMQNKDGHSQLRLKQVKLASQKSADGVRLSLNSDFAQGYLSGKLDFAALRSALTKLAQKSFPDLFEENAQTTSAHRNAESQRWNLRMDVENTDVLSPALGIPFTVKKNLRLEGYLDSGDLYSSLQLRADSVEIGGVGVHDLRLSANAGENGSALLVQAVKPLRNSALMLQVKADAHDNELKTSAAWQEMTHRHFRGDLAAVTHFRQNDEGKHSIHVNFLPTSMAVGDTIWSISGGNMDVVDGIVELSQLSVSNKVNQSIVVEGRYSSSPEDSIVASLNDINVKYILDLVNFRSVILDGQATGKAVLRTDNGKLDAHADLHLPHLYFNNTEMGAATVLGKFDYDNKKIFLDADIGDAEKHETLHGFIDIDDKLLDLNFTALHSPIGFLNFFTKGILTQIDGKASGTYRLYGTFRDLDFGGDVHIESGGAFVPSIGVHYDVDDARVLFTPGKITFMDARIRDGQNGTGILNGCLTHEHIRHMQYDFTANFYDALVCEIPKQMDSNFYATARGSGFMRLQGGPGVLQVDVDITTSVGTDFTYINDTPEAVVNGGYLRFHSKNKEELTDASKSSDEDTNAYVNKSDMRLNFNINLTPDAAVHVVMDEKSGDVINLHGRGTLAAHYYNKGDFRMYGVCNVDHGLYRFSIQDVIRKNFKLVEGGTITFAGAPMDADLNVQAYYTVNSASLADLNAGTNFSDNKVRVNCLLNITGHANAPQLTFDLELPNVNSDEEQMVRKLIATEEDMNMQILYLLGVGRFYTYDAASRAADGNALAATNSVNSFISSTISGQLNEFLDNALHSSNWSFGTNLATGQQGWNDIEVEALLSGRLLDNRLQINGQFGYRDRASHPTSNNFIGDFDIQYLLTRNGNYRLKAYNETNDRYFTKSALMTQGIGFMFQKDFESWADKRRRRQLLKQQK